MSKGEAKLQLYLVYQWEEGKGDGGESGRREKGEKGKRGEREWERKEAYHYELMYFMLDRLYWSIVMVLFDHSFECLKARENSSA